MGKFLHHAPCPNCGSKDNLGIYDDGSQWCFGCHYYVPPNGFNRARKAVVEKDRGVYLPSDSEPYYPYLTLLWAKEYDLNENDLRTSSALWSESSKLLIFPFRGSKQELVGWQGRNFGDVYRTKWYGRGDLEDVLVFFGEGNECILTEDIISAIKVSKAGYKASPIFGSHISIRRLKRLKLVIDRLVVWLDSDKIKEAHKACKRAQLLGIPSRTVYTKLDPKCYSLEAIKDILT